MSDSPAYLHGYTPEEQQRLLSQSDVLAPWVYADVKLPADGPLLEVGAGVGAQTRHLLRRTGAEIVCLEYDERQLATLRQVLAGPIASGRVRPVRGDARAIPLEPASVSGAFLCWVLEHIPGPDAVLREVFRVLRPGAGVVLTEVQNQSLTLLPRDADLVRFWEAVNRTQVEIGGDPYVGARLGGLLAGAGYTDIDIRFVPVLCDSRDPEKRRAILEYFQALLHSAVPAVRAMQKGHEDLDATIDAAFERAKREPDSVFLYTFAQATARKPEGA